MIEDLPPDPPSIFRGTYMHYCVTLLLQQGSDLLTLHIEVDNTLNLTRFTSYIDNSNMASIPDIARFSGIAQMFNYLTTKFSCVVTVEQGLMRVWHIDQGLEPSAKDLKIKLQLQQGKQIDVAKNAILDLTTSNWKRKIELEAKESELLAQRQKSSEIQEILLWKERKTEEMLYMAEHVLPKMKERLRKLEKIFKKKDPKSIVRKVKRFRRDDESYERLEYSSQSQQSFEDVPCELAKPKQRLNVNALMNEIQSIVSKMEILSKKISLQSSKKPKRSPSMKSITRKITIYRCDPRNGASDSDQNEEKIKDILDAFQRNQENRATFHKQQKVITQIYHHQMNPYKFYFNLSYKQESCILQQDAKNTRWYTFVNGAPIRPGETTCYEISIVKHKEKKIRIGFCTENSMLNKSGYNPDSIFYDINGFLLIGGQKRKSQPLPKCQTNDRVICEANLNEGTLAWWRADAPFMKYYYCNNTLHMEKVMILESPLLRMMQKRPIFLAVMMSHAESEVQIRLMKKDG